MPGGEFPTAGEVGAIERGGRVDDKEGEAGLAHHVGGLIEELELVIGVVGAGVGYVVKDFFARETKAVGNCEKSDGSKGAFRVDVETFALATAHIKR